MFSRHSKDLTCEGKDQCLCRREQLDTEQDLFLLGTLSCASESRIRDLTSAAAIMNLRSSTPPMFSRRSNLGPRSDDSIEKSSRRWLADVRTSQCPNQRPVRSFRVSCWMSWEPQVRTLSNISIHILQNQKNPFFRPWMHPCRKAVKHPPR